MSGQHTQGRLCALPNGEIHQSPYKQMPPYNAIAFAPNGEDARRLAACWNAYEGFQTEDIEEFSPLHLMPVMAAVKEKRELINVKDRVDWLQKMNTLHRAVEMRYIVNGYHVTLTYDGEPISPDYWGETLEEAIDIAMYEFDAEARPKWISRDGDPLTMAEQIVELSVLNEQLIQENQDIAASYNSLSDATYKVIKDRDAARVLLADVLGEFKYHCYFELLPLTKHIRAFLNPKGGK